MFLTTRSFSVASERGARKFRVFAVMECHTVLFLKEKSTKWLWLFSNLNRTFLAKLMAEKETRLCIYDPENKKQSKEWHHSQSPLQK